MTAVDLPGATAEPSRLILHANRHVTLVLDDGTKMHLRPPNLDEWRVILAAYLKAEEDDPEDLVPETARGPLQRQYGGRGDNPDEKPDSPFATAFATTVKILTGSELAPGRLPIWASSPRVFTSLYDQWRRVDIVIEDAEPDAAEVPPGGYGAVSSQSANLPPAPAGEEAPVVVYDPDADADAVPVVDYTAPVVHPVAGGMGPGTAPGAARLAPTPAG